MSQQPLQETTQKQTYCCGLCEEDEPPKAITVDADAVEREIDMDEVLAPTIFVTTNSSLAAGRTLVDDFGYINATYIAHKPRRGASREQMLVNEAVEKEKCRSCAIGRLRAKAETLGANAVMSLKIDIEDVSMNAHAGQAIIQMGATCVVASGSAVVINPPVDVKVLANGKPPTYRPPNAAGAAPPVGGVML